jgi:hypothetical protein
MKIEVNFGTLDFNSQDVVSLQKAVDITKKTLQTLKKNLEKQFPHEIFFAKMTYFKIPVRVETATRNEEILQKFKRRFALLQGKNEHSVPMNSDEATEAYNKGLKEDGLE